MKIDGFLWHDLVYTSIKHVNWKYLRFSVTFSPYWRNSEWVSIRKHMMTCCCWYMTVSYVGPFVLFVDNDAVITIMNTKYIFKSQSHIIYKMYINTMFLCNYVYLCIDILGCSPLQRFKTNMEWIIFRFTVEHNIFIYFMQIHQDLRKLNHHLWDATFIRKLKKTLAEKCALGRKVLF